MISDQDKTDTKQLFLLRHALTLPASGGQDDSARALAPQGVEDAQALGRYMKTSGYSPDYILCSSALRTQQTLQHLQKTLPLPKAHILPILYNGAAGDYFSEIKKLLETSEKILIIGHNPAIYELAARLVLSGKERFMHKLSEGYKPATLSVLSCPVRLWHDLNLGENTLSDCVDPTDYNAPARPTRWM